MQREVIEYLKPNHMQPLKVGQYILDDLPDGSHLRVVYSSDRVIPITIELTDISFPDILLVYLQPAIEGEVLIPLKKSWAWNGKADGVAIHTYGLTETPVLIAAGIGLEPSSMMRLGAALKHFTYPEPFRFSSTNLLSGYYLTTIPFSALWGSILIIALFIVIIIKRKRAFPVIGITCFIFLAVYQVRFLTDIASSTIRDRSEWKNNQTFHELGDVYPIASTLNKISEMSQNEISVSVCGRMLSPLKYSLYPTSVTPASESFSTATHAALIYPWFAFKGTIYCEDQSRGGFPVDEFADGGAVAEFSP